MTRQGLRVKVKGAERLARTTSRAADDVRDHAALNAREARELADRMRQGAPRDTGRLQGSVEATSGPESVEAGSRLSYAAPVEYGVAARDMPAQPYARPALAGFVPDYIDDLSGALQDDVDRIQGA